MLSRQGLFALSALALGLPLGGQLADAATITVCGPTICYEYDDSQPASVLFGNPVLIGDELRFLPGTFTALSANGGAVLTSATFLIDRVYTTSGPDIASITISEVGDYRIFGGGDVAADISLLVADNHSTAFTAALNSFGSAGDSGGLQPWNLSATADLVGAFGGSSDVAISLSNLLLAATSASGELAFVQKQLVLGAITRVPVPAAGLLLLTAIAGLSLSGLRKRG